jgi:hypothetical protein
MMGFLLVLLLLSLLLSLLPLSPLLLLPLLPLLPPLLLLLLLLLLPPLLLLVDRRGDALRAGPVEARNLRNLRNPKGLAASLAREDKLSIC